VIECLDPVEAGARWCDLNRLGQFVQELGPLGSKITTGWMAAERAGGSPSEPKGTTLPSEEQASKMLIERLAWRTCVTIHVTIREYLLRLGSALQHVHVRHRRAKAHRRCVAEAVGRAPNSQRVTEMMQRFTETLPRPWQETKWMGEYPHKKTYYRRTVDGVPLLGKSYMRRAVLARCGCGVRPGQGESRDMP
jgi:hypothetical protein